MITRYANTNLKRLEYIGGFDPELVNDPATQIGFIKSKGLFMEYILKNYNEDMVTITRKGKRRQTTRANAPSYYFDDRWTDMQKIKYENKAYYIGVRDSGISESYEVYCEAPRIINDDTFHWKDNSKYGTRETIIPDKVMEYFISVDKDNKATVDIRYTACNNRHRNKVTLATIEIFNASNEEILDAIKEWKTEFKDNF